MKGCAKQVKMYINIDLCQDSKGEIDIWDDDRTCVLKLYKEPPLTCRTLASEVQITDFSYMDKRCHNFRKNEYFPIQ